MAQSMMARVLLLISFEPHFVYRSDLFEQGKCAPLSESDSRGLSAHASSIRKVKYTLYYSVFKKRVEAIEKVPLTFHTEKLRGMRVTTKFF